MFGIVANIPESRTLRNGAKVLIQFCNGDAERPHVEGLGKGGRKVGCYTAYKKLTNFRASWLTETERKFVWPNWQWADRADAEKFAATLSAKWTSPPTRGQADE